MPKWGLLVWGLKLNWFSWNSPTSLSRIQNIVKLPGLDGKNKYNMNLKLYPLKKFPKWIISKRHFQTIVYFTTDTINIGGISLGEVLFCYFCQIGKYSLGLNSQNWLQSETWTLKGLIGSQILTSNSSTFISSDCAFTFLQDLLFDFQVTSNIYHRLHQK